MLQHLVSGFAAAISSFVGGMVATIALVLVAPPLARLALSFGPPEFFALMLFGLCLVSGLAGRSMLAALLMTVLGLLLAMIGIDPLRGTGIGFALGLIPGIGAIVPTFMAYIAEKRLSKTPERFGKGAIEGVAAPESANNAYANAAMIPFLTLGIPSSPTIAVLMGAFIINGITPGPFLFQERPDLVWTVIASFFIGNVILLALNLPLVGLWAKLLHLPFPYLCAGTLLFCVIGAYSLQQSIFDVWVMIAFGIIGYVFRKLDLPLAPLVLGLILGPAIEKSMRTSLEMSAGDYSIFFTRPLCSPLQAPSPRQTIFPAGRCS